MRRLKKVLSSHNGIVLVLAAAAIAIMLIMTVAMASLGFQSRILAIRTTQDILARASADAGHDRALFKLNRQTSNWPDGYDPSTTQKGLLPGTNQSYTFKITEPAVIPPEAAGYDYVYNIEATGLSGTSSPKQRKVYSTVVLKGPFEYGFFVEETLDIKASASLDGYNSADGDYGAGNMGEELSIGTNAGWEGAITLKSGVEISEGSTITVGPLEPGVLSPGDVVAGTFPDDDVFSNSEKVVWDVDIPYEFDPTAEPYELHPGDPNGTWTPGTHIYSSVRLWSDTTLTVTGGSVEVSVGAGGMIIDGSATLNIVAGSSLKLYMAGNFIAKVNSTLNNVTNEPKNLMIFGTENCTKIEIKNNGDFSGAIYAPNAELWLKNSGDIYGSFVGREGYIHNGAKFHYDQALRTLDPGDLGAKFKVVRWSEE